MRFLASRSLAVLVFLLVSGVPDARSERYDVLPAQRRQRAFANVLALDQVHHWSSKPAWTSLSGWEHGVWGWSPKNVSVDAFPAGRPASPAEEFASFAARILVPESAEESANLACRYLAHWATIARLAGPALAIEAPRCNPFDAWARRSTFDGFEVILVAPSGVNPGSLFGHTFLRLRYRDEALLDSRTAGFLADVELPFRDDAFYAVKGVFGSYQAHLLVRPFVALYNDYVSREARNLRRWRLRLSPVEAQDLLERIWTLQTVGAYRYYFFTDNCASLTIDLINGVLPAKRRITFPRLMAAGPTGTVEGMAFTAAYDGGSLLEFESEMPSFRDEALAAEELRHGLPDEFHARNDTVRIAAYQAAATVAPEILAVSLPVEFYVNTVRNLWAEAELENARLKTLRSVRAALEGEFVGACRDAAIEASAPTRARRYLAYRRLAVPACAEPMGQAHAMAFVRLSAELFEDAESATGCHETCLRTAGVDPALVVHPHVTTVSRPVAYLAEMAVPAPARPRPKSAADRHTGIDTISVGFATAGSDKTFEWSAAVLDERLGDQRAFGFPDTSEMTVLQSRVGVSLRGRVADSESRVFGFRTVKPKFDELESFPGFGWETAADVRTSRIRGVSTETIASAGVLAPIAKDQGLANHVLVAIGLRYAGAYATTPVPSKQAVAGYARLETRRAVSLMNPGDDRWSAALEVAPYYDTLGKTWGLRLQGVAEIRAQVSDDDTVLRWRHIGTHAYARATVTRGDLSFAPDPPTETRLSVGLLFE